VTELGGIDILVNNAAHQATFKDIEDISDQEWELTFRVNIHAMFYLVKAAVPHMKPGSVIINTASINSDVPNPTLLAYATTKGAIHNFTAGLAQKLAEKGIRSNAVAPGPIWTPLIPSTMPAEAVSKFGGNVPMKRPGQPAELATAYVMLADPLSSYVSGATIAVTGGRPFLSRQEPNWHSIATLATWLMTLVIQRAEHRDTQALQAKPDELLRAPECARNELTRIERYGSPRKSRCGAGRTIDVGGARCLLREPYEAPPQTQWPCPTFSSSDAPLPKRDRLQRALCLVLANLMAMFLQRLAACIGHLLIGR
jgi:hypothetical protein